jgi:glycosyltransferase involved in cell wall biosynthesis
MNYLKRDAGAGPLTPEQVILHGARRGSTPAIAPFRPRVAIVHDWLYTYGGAERVLRSLLRCLPGADVFTLFDVLSPADRARIGFTTAKTSFLQRLPGIRRRHRLYLPLMPIAIEQFDLSAYDLIVSSSYAVAKGVLTGPNQLHLSYVHSPMRYAWDMQHQYLAGTGPLHAMKRGLASLLLHRMRLWDTRTAHGVDAYMVNSHFIGRRVRKTYGRNARVIHPPVDVPAILTAYQKKRYFLTASRLVPYKNIDALIIAFRELPDQRLVVAGAGPELERLKSLAGANVSFAGFVPDQTLRRLMGEATAFLFAAEEDFGIVTLEAQAEGTPVIALGRGGACETIVTEGTAPTGLFFTTPEPPAIAAAVRQFLARVGDFRPADCHANARRFGEARFEAEIRAFVAEQLTSFREQLQVGRAMPAPPAPQQLATTEA